MRVRAALALGVLVAPLGVNTMAYWSSRVVIAPGAVQAGSFDLKVNGGDQQVALGLDVADMAPNTSTAAVVTLGNASSGDNSVMTYTVDAATADTAPTGTGAALTAKVTTASAVTTSSTGKSCEGTVVPSSASFSGTLVATPQALPAGQSRTLCIQAKHRPDCSGRRSDHDHGDVQGRPEGPQTRDDRHWPAPARSSSRDLHRGADVALTVAAVLGGLSLVTALVLAVAGMTPLVFTSGSMGPAIPTGSLALARSVPVDELVVGDVVSVRDARGTRVTHRVVAVDDAGLTLRGDANPTADAGTYDVAVADRVLLSVPHAGTALAAADRTRRAGCAARGWPRSSCSSSSGHGPGRARHGPRRSPCSRPWPPWPASGWGSPGPPREPPPSGPTR